jgi:hypothetical protein
MESGHDPSLGRRGKLTFLERYGTGLLVTGLIAASLLIAVVFAPSLTLQFVAEQVGRAPNPKPL